MRNKIKKIPVPVLPTMVGAMTLSNVLSGLGFIWIRPIMMVLATVVWCLYLAKMILHPEDVKKDYEHVVSSSLFPAFFMMMKIGRAQSELQSRFDLVCRLLLEKTKLS